MSRKSVEILRRGIDAFNRGDDEQWLAVWHEDAEMYDFGELPDVPQPFRGREGVRDWAANVRSVLGDFRMDPRTITPIGDAVLAEIEVRGVGEQSGVPVGMVIYVIAWTRRDEIIRTRAFLDKAQALEAAGLPE